MQIIVKLLAIFIASVLGLYGCGGGSSSSPPINTSPPTSSGSWISTIINPLRDLGFGKGEKVCFKLKSYNNVTGSDFSKAICAKINNEHSLTLAWNKVTGNVNGYYVYFGTNENNATNFLVDVFES